MEDETVVELLGDHLISWKGVLTEEQAAELVDHDTQKPIHMFMMDWREATKLEQMTLYGRIHWGGENDG